MGLANWFETFCNDLVMDGASIADRCKRITRRLNLDFRGTDSETANRFYVGSYGRNTRIRSVSDVDLLYEMPASEYAKYDAYSGNGQSALLQAVKRSIATTYPTSEVAGDGQVVIVTFDSGVPFDVLAAFLNKSGSYTFANANGGGSWKTTDPKPEIAEMRAMNAACDGNLVQLCHMARSWKSEWNVSMGGLLIDTLAYQFIQTWAHRKEAFFYYDLMARDFFDYLALRDGNQQYWVAPGSGRYVYRDGNFEYKATQCRKLAKEAIAHETATPKQEWSAKQKWRSIFGTRFPD